MSITMSTALIPYTPPKTPQEFVKSEVERALENGTITPFHPSVVLDFGLLGQETIKKMVDALKRHSLQIRYNNKTKKFTVLESSSITKEVIEKIFSAKNYLGWKPIVLDEVDQFGNRLVQLSSIRLAKLKFIVKSSSKFVTVSEPFYRPSSPNRVSQVASLKLNGDEIAEVLQAEAGFTIATDKKPILATYGCRPCVALGGYDQTNKIAFVVHFSNADELRNGGGLIFYNIAKLAKEKITTPIQLHLRGGIEGISEPIIEAIKSWMTFRKDLPMEIASKDILNSDIDTKSLLIDSRTGVVSDYDPNTNSKSRGLSTYDINSVIIRLYDRQIKLAYSPK